MEVEFAAGRPQRVSAPSGTNRSDPYWDLQLVVQAWAAFERGESIEVHGARSGYDGLSGVAAEVRGLDEATQAEYKAAARAFEEAAESWSGLSARSMLRCAWAQGEFLRRACETQCAAEHLIAVEAQVSEMDIRPLVARVRTSLRKCGVSIRGSEAQDGWAELSPREAEVIGLVGDGHTSAQIAQLLGVARSTIETQVRSAMVKLGSSTRIEAAAVLRSARA